MHVARALLSCCLAALASAPASAEPSFHGSLSERLQLQAPRASSLLSTRDRPVLQSLSEANLQGRARLLDDALFVAFDASAFLTLQGGYADLDPQRGVLVAVDEHDTGARPLVVFSEAYGSLEPFDHLLLTVGKRRVVWGPGIAFSPTDVLNPPRDPTDPASQREGRLLVAVDVPFERLTLSALFLPGVLSQESGIPTRLVVGPEDDRLRYAAVLRAYALLFDADWNAWAVWSNHYVDERHGDLRLMATLSKTLFDVHAAHAEVVLKRGSSRLYPNERCAVGEGALARCMLEGEPPLSRSKLDDDALQPEILLGWRTFFPDDAMASVEYLYQADALLPQEHGDFARLLAKIGDAQRRGLAPAVLDEGAGQGSTPLRFSFQPIRRHHLFLSYTRPRVLDDLTVQGALITALEDLSSLASASVSWSAQEWLTLSLWGFVPLPSAGRISTWLPGDPIGAADRDLDDAARGFLPSGALVEDERYGEYDLLPDAFRLVVEARVWF